MQSETTEQERIRAYLLGQIAQTDLPDLEQRLLIDAAFFEELSIVEDELIDEYLDGGLAAPARQSFESHFMSAPERREKLRFAQALKKHVSAFEAAQSREDIAAQSPAESSSEAAEPPPKKRPLFSFLPFRNPIVSYALAAALLVIVGGVSWVAWKNSRTTPPGKVLAIELIPSSLTRGDDREVTKIAVPADTKTVRLQLNLPADEYPSYEAALQDDNFVTLSTTRNLKSQSSNGRPMVFVEVPQSLLPHGDYRLKLSGITADGNSQSVSSYYFRLVR